MRDCSWLSADTTMMNSQCLPLPTLSMLPTSAPQYEPASDWHCSQLDIKQERADHMMDHDSSATSGVGSNSGASPGGCSSASSERSPSAPAQAQATAPAPAPGQACLASPTPASATSPRSGSTLNYDPLQSLQGLAPESAKRSPTSPPTPADDNSRSSEGSFDEHEHPSEHMDTSTGGSQMLTQGNVLRCHLCEFTDTSRDVMSEHIASHYDNQEPGLSPDEADDGEYDEASLSTPKFNAQGKVKTFRCKNCGHVTFTKVQFWEHHRTHIKDDRVLECPRCPFVTEYKHHLEYHLRNHFNSKPYKCDKCSYACVNKSMLNSHLKSHSNVYQYHCQDCAYATKYCHSLKLHLRKYGHRPSVVLNADGTPNPLPIIDVYGTRRGPKNKSHLSPSGGTMASQGQPGNGTPAPPSSVPLPTGQMTPSQMFPFGLMTPGLGYQTPPAVRRCPYCEFYSGDAEQLAKHMFLHTDPSVIHFLQANNNNNNNNNNNPEGLKDYLASLMWQQSNVGRSPIQRAAPTAPLTPTPQPQPTTAPPQASPVAPPTAPHTPPPAHTPPATMSPTPTQAANVSAPSSPASGPASWGAPAKPARTAAPLDLSMPETSSMEDSEEAQRHDANTPAPAAGAGSKNRRKGRAFKLERIAMLLQQQSGDESEAASAAAAFAAAAAAAASQPSPPSSPQSPAASATGTATVTTPAPASQTSSVQEAYNCTYCDITFKDVVMYTMHMGYHGYQDPFLCNMCGQQTTDKVSFFLHVARSSHC